MVHVLYLAVCAHSYGYTQFDWFFDEPRQHLTVVGAGDALDGNRVYGQISSLIDLEPEKAFVVFDPQRRKCFVPVKTKAVECDEKVRPEDRRIDEAAERSREHYDPEIVSQNSRQVARQNEQDDQECEDVGKGVTDLNPVALVEIVAGIGNQQAAVSQLAGKGRGIDVFRKCNGHHVWRCYRGVTNDLKAALGHLFAKTARCSV